MKRHTQNHRRVLAAFACLLAVVFLYVPFAAAAWSSHVTACCTSGYCNVPKHHHKKAPGNSTAAEECGHDGHNRSSILDCSMSCCQDPDKPAVSAVAFVLPPSTIAAASPTAARAVDCVHSIEIPRTIEPLSPPPRTNNAAR